MAYTSLWWFVLFAGEKKADNLTLQDAYLKKGGISTELQMRRNQMTCEYVTVLFQMSVSDVWFYCMFGSLLFFFATQCGCMCRLVVVVNSSSVSLPGFTLLCFLIRLPFGYASIFIFRVCAGPDRLGRHVLISIICIVVYSNQLSVFVVN